MKSRSFIAALFAAFGLFFFFIPSAIARGPDPTHGHCLHLRDMWDMYSGAYRENQFPKKDKALLERCRELNLGKRQTAIMGGQPSSRPRQVQQQQPQRAQQTRKINLGWLFR